MIFYKLANRIGPIRSTICFLGNPSYEEDDSKDTGNIGLYTIYTRDYIDNIDKI